MGSTPNLNELKKACDSDKLHHALRLLFLYEEADNEGLIMVMNEKCDDVRARIGKKRALLQEAGSFNASNPVVANGVQCLEEAQSKDFKLLGALVVLLDQLHEERSEKRRYVLMMEQYN